MKMPSLSAIWKIFRKKENGQQRERATVLTGPRVPRSSSGWQALQKFLRDEQGLRILDIGPTSSQNINFLTNLGHSVYMADLVHEAIKGGWQIPASAPGEPPGFNVEGFFDHNPAFQPGREFDVVLLWATLDYVPEALVKPLISRLKDVTRRGGKVLAAFHSKAQGPWTAYCRYHLTEGPDVEMQESEHFPIQRVYTNRKIEQLFDGFTNSRFFLAKDNLYEVLLTR
ncbi:MAG TPA: class I SAM-dependent methyltransferase [Acidobacteriaceae bacterium]|nr:class I SAM-dependent methyltransferase [Acidobacteriaceae bacterium]